MPLPEFIVRPTMKFVKLGYTAVFVLIGLALALASNLGWPVWYAAAAAVLLLWPLARHLRRLMTKMTVAGDKLRYEAGFFSKTIRTIQLQKVQDVTVHQTLGQRMFGVGNLSIETAGETSRLTVVSIDDPQGVADRIMATIQPSGRSHGV
jgi:uncharacterized membrane protein YdbT with pleckstrin-like domain